LLRSNIEQILTIDCSIGIRLWRGITVFDYLLVVKFSRTHTHASMRVGQIEALNEKMITIDNQMKIAGWETEGL
jgi:hypothetical protein